MNTTRPLVLIAFSVLPIVSYGVGSPAIESAMPIMEDSFQQGDSMRISGSGFGEGNRATPILWDTVENQVSYNGLKDGDRVPSGVDYPWNRASVFLDQSSDQRHRHSSGQYLGPEGGTNRVARPVVDDGFWESSDQKEVFVSWWIKFDRPVYEIDNNASHKLVRIWGGGGEDLRISWITRNNIFISNRNAGGSSAKNSYSPINARDLWKEDQWQLHEIWASAEHGEIKAYVDGKLVNHWADEDSRYLKTDHPKGPRVTLLGWNPAHGNGYVANASFKTSDILVNDSRARVLLSAAETFSDSTAHEYQPVKEWSKTNIEFGLNYGALSKDESLYLYIVNHEGDVNSEGYPLRCLECPEPIDLRVKPTD